jgi:hypothetical protein
MRRTIVGAVCWVAVVGIAGMAAGEDAFYDVPLSALKVTSGEFPKPDNDWERWRLDRFYPVPMLDGEGEAYFDAPGKGMWGFRSLVEDLSAAHLVVRAPKGKEITGRVGIPNPSANSGNLLKFSVPASTANDSAKEAFYLAKLHHYEMMSQQVGPGRAWFRHEILDADQKLRQLDPKKYPANGSASQNWIPTTETDAYDLFSGGKAISENLQIDRALREPGSIERADVDIKTLTGITIEKIDWSKLLKGANPKLDPLAKLIPADQHVLFFPTFADVIRLSDEAKQTGSLLTRVAAMGGDNMDVFERYQRQLGLPLSELVRVVGKAAIKSVAVTGSDPYFPTGTDFAVILETDHPDVLAGLLSAQIALTAAKFSGAEMKSGEVGGLKYQSVRSADRNLSSYLAQLDGAVVVTNSPAQMEKLLGVKKLEDSIAGLDEYKFFRMRYPVGDNDETAFLFLSDDTIRRWCSPRWRIASARRTFAAAEMAEMTADHMAPLVNGKANGEALQMDVPLLDAGDFTLNKGGVTSSRLGTLEFMTPIVELPIEKVTKAEADAYNFWRDGYEQNWRWAFDPIGLRIGVSDSKLATDLTVMPLILGSEYREYVSISRGAEIKPESGDRHQSLGQVILAINKQSEQMKNWGNMTSMFAPQAHIDAFGWLGSWATLYLDDSPLWEKLHGMSKKERREYLEKHWSDLPVGLEAEVSSPLKLTAFLAALRAFVEQTAPGMVTWESLTYRDQPYVRVKATERARRSIGGDTDAEIAICYAPMGDRLSVVLNEDVLKHVLDREADWEAAQKGTEGK